MWPSGLMPSSWITRLIENMSSATKFLFNYNCSLLWRRELNDIIPWVKETGLKQVANLNEKFMQPTENGFAKARPNMKISFYNQGDKLP